MFKMQKTITNYYLINSQSIAMKAYKSLYVYLKNKVFQENKIIPKYTQKLITDYYSYAPKIQYSKNVRQSLITEFYHKN